MQHIVQNLVATQRVKWSRLASLRIKTHTPCQWTCSFCHMEGNHESSRVSSDEKFFQELQRLMEHFSFSEVHFTGGEPSIHPSITEMVRRTSRLGYTCKMTSNGQAPLEKYLELAEAGLKELTLSIHTLNGAALGGIMSPKRDEAWGLRNIQRQLNLLRDLPITRKINTVVSEDEDEAVRIGLLAEKLGVKWRPMNDLTAGEASYAALKRLCERLNATPHQVNFTHGTSSYTVVATTERGFEFNIKLIRPFRLTSMCNGCPLDAEGRCQEFAYGPRVEAANEELVIRSCLHQNGAPYTLEVQEFLTSQVASDLCNAIAEVP